MQDDPPPSEPANPAAWLARRRWAKETAEERTANAQEATRKRWQDNPEAMLEYMREMTRRRPSTKGKPRILERCPCGKFSLTLAAKRGHKCQAPEPIEEDRSMDICDFCKRPIGNDEATFTDDEGHVLHLTCAEIEAEESEEYLESDSD